jgi:hypothetical protein
MNYVLVTASKLAKDISGPVGRMVIDDYNIEAEIGVLRDCALDRIANRPHPIADRDYNAGILREPLLALGQSFK